MEVAVIATWVIMLIASVFNTPTTTIVLAENDKEHNAIVIQTDAGSTLIDKPGQYVSLTSKNDAPSSIKTMTKENIDKKFKAVQKAAPLKPVYVNLYFKSNSNGLTEESARKLPKILKMIQDRTPCDVSIIGHTDTKGQASYNEKLALERAKYIKKWVLSSNVELNNLKAKSYGESDLLVETKDNVSEPKNRRVEIFIK
jgi:outer membrane protein OmpA-like peptidoglycan-associated protein